ncbi:MAG: ABC transporter substrate-binding protein [Rhodospirillales bacterium]|nr:ABC transporter substrate-binding protein [Rhodospirillales bacterium]MDE2575701.1 ABC transporter substrate-binding protein [Rhodospirillales bacterium]
MRRRDILKSAAAVPVALAAPKLARAAGSSVLKFIPQADVASLDPVWTTADITRNYSLAVYDTLYGIDAKFAVQPQMVAGHTTSADGKQWELTLRDGLKFHDNTPVLARDCVASIKRWGANDPLGSALMARTDEVSAPSDKVIRFRLKEPFALLPSALSQYSSCIMPERVTNVAAGKQVTESIGSGPFRFNTKERVVGSLMVFDKFEGYVPRADGVPSFTAGPKIAYFDRVEWHVVPDPATSAGALTSKEVDWWENPALDLVPSLEKNHDLVLRVTDISGEIGCLRFNCLLPPFDNPAIRRVVLKACNQSDFMDAVAGSVPKLVTTDVGVFVPGTPMASTVGIGVTHGSTDYAALKKELAAAGYKGEKIVLLAATTISTIYAEAQVAADLLKKIGFNVDMQSLDWGTVVQRRASMSPLDKGGWSIFFTFLGGPGNVSPAPNIAIRGNGKGAWVGWPTDPKMEALRNAWFTAPDLAAQQKLCEQMQVNFWQTVPYVPLGMYKQPTAYRNYLKDIRDGYPQMYGVKRA